MIVTSYIVFVIFVTLYLSRCKELGGHKISNLSSYALLALVLITTRLALKRQIKKIRPVVGDYIFCFYICISLISTIFSVYPSHSFKMLTKNLPIQIAVYIFIRTIMQHLELKKQLFIWWISLLLPVISPFIMKTNWLKPVGVFSHANAYAHFGMIFAILSLSLSTQNLIFLPFTIPGIYGLIETSSRMPFMALSSATIVTIVFSVAIIQEKRRVLKIAIIFFTTLSILFTLAMKNPKMKNDLLRIFKNPQKDGSAQIRLRIAHMCVKLFKEKPLTGWGYGRTTRMMLKDPSKLPWIKEYLKWMTKNFYEGKCHNSTLELAIQAGIVGLIYGIMLQLYPIWLLLLSLKKLKGRSISEIIITITPTIAMLALSINMLTEVILFSKRGLLLYSCLAFCANSEELLKSPPPSPPPTSSSAPD